jgi:hypothetical protein
MSYSSNRCTGGAATASSVVGSHTADLAFDGNTSTWWGPQDPISLPEWIKYDFGVGVSWTIAEITIKPSTANYVPNAFTVSGSNNDSAYTDLYSGNCANNTNVQTFPFSNLTKYRYIRITFTSMYGSGTSIAVAEIEMYSELNSPSSSISSSLSPSASSSLSSSTSPSGSISQSISPSISPSGSVSSSISPSLSPSGSVSQSISVSLSPSISPSISPSPSPEFGLDKLSTSATYGSVWRSNVYSVGKTFAITEIRIPLGATLTSGMTITPKVYFDDSSTVKTMTTINSTNFSGRYAIYKNPEINDYIGTNNFFIELNFSGTVYCPVLLPINVQLDIYLDEP